MTKNDVSLLLQVKEYLDTHLTSNITIAELCDRFLINRTKLQSGFQQLFVTSVYAYIVNRRLDWAANRIRTTDDPIKVIALDAGYKKHRSFNKCFKRIFGHTPSSYRRQYHSQSANVQPATNVQPTTNPQ